MKKKLKIKFWKAERALAMQILEQEGLPKRKRDKGIVRILASPCLFYVNGEVCLRGELDEWDYGITSARFDTNQDRDAYLDKMTQAITDELFTGTGELKVGDMCEVRDRGYEKWKTQTLLAILPSNYGQRFITKHPEDANDWLSYDEARPINKRIEPKVETNGEVITYTWEE